MSKKADDLQDSDVSDSYRYIEQQESISNETQKKKKAKKERDKEQKEKKSKETAEEMSKEMSKEKTEDRDKFTMSDLTVVPQPSKIEFHDKQVDKKLDEKQADKKLKKQVKFEDSKSEDKISKKKKSKERKTGSKKSGETAKSDEKIKKDKTNQLARQKSDLVIVIDSKTGDKKKAEKKRSSEVVAAKSAQPSKSKRDDTKTGEPQKSSKDPTKPVKSKPLVESKPTVAPTKPVESKQSVDLKPSVDSKPTVEKIKSTIPKSPSDLKPTVDPTKPVDSVDSKAAVTPTKPVDSKQSVTSTKPVNLKPSIDLKPTVEKTKSIIPKPSSDSSKGPKGSKGDAKAVLSKGVTPKSPAKSKPPPEASSSEPKITSVLKSESGEPWKSEPSKLAKSTSDEFPYKKNLVITSRVDLPNNTDSSLGPQATKSKDALEQIKSKLDGQANSKFSEPTNQQKLSSKLSEPTGLQKPSSKSSELTVKQKPSSSQSNKPDKPDKAPSSKPEKKKTVSSVKEPKKLDKKEKSPSVDIKQDQHQSEINIKSGQDLKANLSLGKQIRAQVEDRESRTQVNKEEPAARANENGQENDWGSISIQLDITKDPKTKKIEISEDVKVLPTAERDGHGLKRLKGSIKKRILPQADKVHEAKVFNQEESASKERAVLKEEDAIGSVEPVVSQKELDQALNQVQPTTLAHRPSITHYVKSDETGQIRLGSKSESGIVFDRFFSSNGEQDQARSDEQKSAVQSIPLPSEDGGGKLLVDAQQIAADAQQASESTQSIKSENLEAVVLYKADTESEKSKDSGRSLKRMDLFNFNKQKSPKKSHDDSSSDEQTYEQIIKQRNETLRLHFPMLSISPPPFQPTPPPFHLKPVERKRSSSQQIKPDSKSEEMTYHEQKRKFSLNQVRYKEESKRTAKDSVGERKDKHVDKLAEQNYENIKRLHIPSEKVAAVIQRPDEPSEPKKHEVRIEKKRPPDDPKQGELKKVEPKNNPKLGDASSAAAKDSPQAESDDQSLTSRFNNELERMRRMERYLAKVKTALNSEQTGLETKRSLVKRLILIKKDLNKLGKLCEQLLEKDYLKPPDKKDRRSSSKRRPNTGRAGYSDDSSNEESSELLRSKTVRIVREELRRKLLETETAKRSADRHLPGKEENRTDKNRTDKNQSGKDRPDKNWSDKDQPDKDRPEKDRPKQSSGRRESGEETKDKTAEGSHKRPHFNDKNDTKSPDEKCATRTKRSLVRLSRRVLSSRKFRFFLLLLVLATVVFSYCYYRRSIMPKRFPCRLKHKHQL